jgi:hypothetical protein
MVYAYRDMIWMDQLDLVVGLQRQARDKLNNMSADMSNTVFDRVRVLAILSGRMALTMALVLAWALTMALVLALTMAWELEEALVDNN